MSTFNGQFIEEELSFIRADNFLSRNFSATSFLLSHLHTDHMAGLGTREFREVLESDENKRLYCSCLSREMLLKYKWCKIPPEKIVGLDVNQAFTVKNPRPPGQQVTITPLPAGHCPGSVMFLIEAEECRVLYTGDVRITDRELKQFRPLHFELQGVKPINHLYLDMTFCAPEYRHFPVRTQTEAQIKDLVTTWLQEDPQNKVGLLYNSYFGLECLLIELARNLASKIHVVEQESLDNYRIVPELRHALTRDSHAKVHLCPVPKHPKKWQPEQTLQSTTNTKQIADKSDENAQPNHSGRVYGPCPVCMRIPHEHLKKIKPCAMSFKLSDKVDLPPKLTAWTGVVRVAYSCHSSLSELAKIVWYLNPDKIFACAMPVNHSASQCIAILKDEIREQDAAGELDTSKRPVSDKLNNQRDNVCSERLWPKWAQSEELCKRREDRADAVWSGDDEKLTKRARVMEEERAESVSESTGEERTVCLQSVLDVDSPPM